MLGDKYLIAPILHKNQQERVVVLPEGNWIDDLGNTYKGNQTINIKVPLDRIPYFIKK
jgi:alpha-glucosidase (family GH31 glycosyl hydrolase)